MYTKRIVLSIAALIGFLVVVLGISIMVGYNGLVDKDEKIDETISQVKIRLQENNDKIGAMLEITGDLTAYSLQVYELVTSARTEYLDAVNSDDLGEITEFGDLQINALVQLFSLIEDNDLVTSEQAFLNLQYEVSAMQSAISQSRRDYNQAVLAYNRAVRRFPGLLYARMVGFETISYWDEPAE